MVAGWNIYLLRCADGTLYTGISTDVERRIREHERGRRGAKYLRGRGPLTLAFEYQVGSRSQASIIEYQVKRLSPAEKQDTAFLVRFIDNMLAEMRTAISA